MNDGVKGKLTTARDLNSPLGLERWDQEFGFRSRELFADAKTEIERTTYRATSLSMKCFKTSIKLPGVLAQQRDVLRGRNIGGGCCSKEYRNSTLLDRF